MHISAGNIEIKHVILIVVSVVIGVAMIPLMQMFIDALELTGSAATVAAWAPAFLVLALLIPIFGFGLNKVDA